MSFDINSTAAQLKAIELLPREYTFLADNFSTDGGIVEDDVAIYDYRKGSKKMAPVVAENVGGVLMNREGFSTKQIGFATIAPERIVTNNDIKGRTFGENVLGAMTPAERDKKMQLKDIVEMRAAVQRRIEYMTRQVLLTGKLELFRYTSEGTEKKTTCIADYGFSNTYTATNLWSANNADIEGDLEALYDLVYEGLGNPDLIVMAPNVWAAMRANDKFMKQVDMLHANMGDINTKYRGQGIRFVGHNADGVPMYVSSGTFINDAGQTEQIVPAGKLIVGSSDALKVMYGPVTQIENKVRKTYMKKLVPMTLVNEDAGVIKNRLTCRPTIVPTNVDSWAVATVL